METLTEKQIDAVIDWMNNWQQLKDTAIPIRFKEDCSKHLNLAVARDLLLDFGSYYEDDKTSTAVDEVVDNYLNQKQQYVITCLCDGFQPT